MASRIAMRTVKEFVEGEGQPAEVTFVLFSDGDLKVYLAVLRELE